MTDIPIAARSTSPSVSSSVLAVAAAVLVSMCVMDAVSRFLSFFFFLFSTSMLPSSDMAREGVEGCEVCADAEVEAGGASCSAVVRVGLTR